MPSMEAGCAPSSWGAPAFMASVGGPGRTLCCPGLVLHWSLCSQAAFPHLCSMTGEDGRRTCRGLEGDTVASEARRRKDGGNVQGQGGLCCCLRVHPPSGRCPPPQPALSSAAERQGCVVYSSPHPSVFHRWRRQSSLHLSSHQSEHTASCSPSETGSELEVAGSRCLIPRRSHPITHLPCWLVCTGLSWGPHTTLESKVRKAAEQPQEQCPRAAVLPWMAGEAWGLLCVGDVMSFS